MSQTPSDRVPGGPAANPYSSPHGSAAVAHPPGKYRTAPLPIKTMPPGIPYIVGNEAAERFSYYGMRGILVIFMTKYLVGADHQLDVMTKEQALSHYHLFVSANYFFPLLGAILADVWWGKYRTILSLSLVYCLGHLALALNEQRIGLAIGLGLIALGSGGIKPCVSSHVGDQFGHSNEHLIERVFGWFYFAINFGATFSQLLTPWLLEQPWGGPRVAFGVPGVLMFLATIVFWMGRNKFVHIPARGYEAVREVLSPVGRTAILKLSGLYLFVAVFWSLYEQTGGAWVLQAQQMDRVLPGSEAISRHVAQVDWGWLNWLWARIGGEWRPAQIQAINPILVMVYIPLFAYVIYPIVGRFVKLTSMRKIGAGLFLIAASFAISGWIETRIQAGETPNMLWQMLAYVVITAAEILVSVTCLEFSYTQAPKQMKAFIMSIFLLSNSMGNLFTFVVNWFIQKEDQSSKLPGASYYWFFVGLMLVTSVAFVIYAQFFREQRFIQDEAADGEAAPAAG